MKTQNDYEIALQVVNTKINSFRRFSYVELCETITKSGGILRVAIGVNIRDYLNELREEKLLFYFYETDEYLTNPIALVNYLYITPNNTKLAKKLLNINSELEAINIFGKYISTELLKLC